MSAMPHPPGRKLWKYSRCPSGENAGAASLLLELTVGPRFCAAPQGSSTLARRETQMSSPPTPPGRPEVMYRLRPSLEIAGRLSSAGELTTGPRLIGVAQGPHVGCSSPTTSAATTPEGRETGPVSRLHAWGRAPHSNRLENLAIGFMVRLLTNGLWVRD